MLMKLLTINIKLFDKSFLMFSLIIVTYIKFWIFNLNIFNITFENCFEFYD